MDTTLKNTLWSQFGAAIDALENASNACPDELWSDQNREPQSWYQFWYLTYHTLFWLDFYLSDAPSEFHPPAPFGLEELDPAGVMPERVYTKAELQTYLEYVRQKCRATISALTDEKASQPIRVGRVDLSFLELLLYNMRHVQHHVGQLNMILRQTIDSAPGWAFRAKGDPIT
jgi:DinB superfamily